MYSSVITITPKTLENFKKAGYWLFKDDGNGFRMKSGKESVYLFKNQVVLA
jgi:hypothetical protein